MTGNNRERLSIVKPFWSNLGEEKKFRERRGRAMSATGHKPVIHTACLCDVIKTHRIERATVARCVALYAQEHRGLETDAALGSLRACWCCARSKVAVS